MTDQTRKVKLLISQAQIKRALSEFDNVLHVGQHEVLRDQMIGLSARFHKNEKQKRMSIISEAEYMLEWNRILTNLTSLIQEYEDEN